MKNDINKPSNQIHWKNSPCSAAGCRDCPGRPDRLRPEFRHFPVVLRLRLRLRIKRRPANRQRLRRHLRLNTASNCSPRPAPLVTAHKDKGMPHLGKDLQTSQFAAGLSDSKLADFITQGRAANDPLNTTHVPMPPKGGNPALSVAGYFRHRGLCPPIAAAARAAK